MYRIVIVLDVDGTVSPVDGESEWGDDVIAGEDVMGWRVDVSPSLCAELDRLDTRASVECVWLTSWTEEMRRTLKPFPGRDWQEVTDPVDPANYDLGLPTLQFAGEDWWKWEAMSRWLADQPDVGGIIWCDDHLSGDDDTGNFGDRIRAELARRDLPCLLIAPKKHVGITPRHLMRIRDWLATYAHPTYGADDTDT